MSEGNSYKDLFAAYKSAYPTNSGRIQQEETNSLWDDIKKNQKIRKN